MPQCFSSLLLKYSLTGYQRNYLLENQVFWVVCGDICNFIFPFEIYLINGKSYVKLTCLLHEMRHNLRMNTYELSSCIIYLLLCNTLLQVLWIKTSIYYLTVSEIRNTIKWKVFRAALSFTGTVNVICVTSKYKSVFCHFTIKNLHLFDSLKFISCVNKLHLLWTLGQLGGMGRQSILTAILQMQTHAVESWVMFSAP